ncbi:MAG TPA: hypothetical protein DIW17_07300 [Clostridiales bacterium]|nr:hypothetical protein [Clostridiales bacterium]
MIRITDERNCCGCAACTKVCPTNCIQMKKRSLGHLFADADETMCINCGACNRVCPMENPIASTDYPQRVYAAYSINAEVRYRGSSGGMFETFATHLIGCGYSVYGAAFNDDLKLKCICATNETELLPLMKSKYLQIDFEDKYFDIRMKLLNGEKVFVISTPCQIAALKRFLTRDYPNLLTADFFCHGVPSQQFFDECNEYDEIDKYGGKVRRYTFRVKKKKGSTPHYYSVEITRLGKLIMRTGYYFDSTFYAFFQRYISLRESCYNCRFAGAGRYADITLGDFHDINKYIKNVNRFDGVSTVVVNTVHGQELLDGCTNMLSIYEMSIERLIADKACFSGGTPRPSNRDRFLIDYKTMRINELAAKYVNKKRYINARIYYSLPEIVRKTVKKVYRSVI